MTKPVSPSANAEEPWGNLSDFNFVFRLYITGVSSLSTRAVVNARRLFDQHLAGRYKLEVVDLAKFPARAAEGQIVASPTLVKESPGPVRRFVGDLSRPEILLDALGLPHEPVR